MHEWGNWKRRVKYSEGRYCCWVNETNSTTKRLGLPLPHLVPLDYCNGLAHALQVSLQPSKGENALALSVTEFDTWTNCWEGKILINEIHPKSKGLKIK